MAAYGRHRRRLVIALCPLLFFELILWTSFWFWIWFDLFFEMNEQNRKATDDLKICTLILSKILSLSSSLYLGCWYFCSYCHRCLNINFVHPICYLLLFSPDVSLAGVWLLQDDTTIWCLFLYFLNINLQKTKGRQPHTIDLPSIHSHSM